VSYRLAKMDKEEHPDIMKPALHAESLVRCIQGSWGISDPYSSGMMGRDRSLGIGFI